MIKELKYSIVGLSLPLLLAACGGQGDVSPYDLQCEYLDTPLGVDVAEPRLTWKLHNAADSVALYLSTDSAAVAALSGDALYRILPPATVRCRCDSLFIADGGQGAMWYWRVVSGKETSAVTHFMTAFEVDAPWISDGKDAAYRPSSYFKKEIVVEPGLKAAYWVVASAGLHELQINGTRVGDHRLDPMFTRFDKRILSVTHDVTAMLAPGDNELRIQLGNGWYNHQSTAVWFFDRAPWRNRPSVSARLVLEYADGTRCDVVTDGTWLTAPSPVVFNSIYTAEHYDARLEADTSEWQPATVVACPTELVKSQLLHPVRAVAEHKATAFSKINDSLYVYTFPRNMAGVTRLVAKGRPGTVLRLKHGEMLYDNGRVNTENIDYHYRPVDDSDPFQTDIVVLGDDTVCFEPKFNYKGFQYVEVEASDPVELDENSLVAIEWHSDVPVKGWWHSSSDYLNRLWVAGNNSYLDNLFGYPTDCPQREKNGWTGDGHIASDLGLYNFDAITVYEKWMDDFADEQRPDGVLPCIVPTAVWGYDWANGVDWTSAVVIVPWNLYLYYGDDGVLRKMYEPMKRYVDYITSIAEGNLTDWGLGDWIPVKTQSDVRLTTSIYYYVDADIMSRVAAVLGHNDDSERYARLATDIRDAINTAYLDTTTAIYASGSQTELAMPLYWNVVPDEYRDAVAANLNNRVVADSMHIDVGLHGCKALLGALSQNGYIDTAYRLVLQDTYPSWGYWIRQGATTFHENWRTDVIIDNSLNHIMFGEVAAWLWKSLAGITPDAADPGFRTTHVEPYCPQGLDSLQVAYNSPLGMLDVQWSRTGDEVKYTLTVPTGMKVLFRHPVDGEKVLYQGKHIFKW